MAAPAAASRRMRAWQTVGDGRLALADVPVPEPGADGALPRRDDVPDDLVARHDR